MYHAIKIFPQSTDDPSAFLNDGVSTWDDFKMVPTTRPYVAPPELKTNDIDIPGSDGSLDLTEAPQGYPTYKNRTGSWEFIVMNDFCQPIDSREEWYTVYSKVMDYLHGRAFRVILEDDMAYFYEGRLTVNEFASEERYSKITIDYNLKPYKWSILKTSDDWLWDPFNFDSGVVPRSYGDKDNPWNIQCWDSDESGIYTQLHFRTIQIEREDIGRAPVNPTIYFKHEYLEDVVPNTAKGIVGLYFKLPGWSENRGYSYNLSKTWEKGFRIPEYNFRSEMTDSELTIKCATALSKTLPVSSAFTTEQKTCPYCHQVGLLPGVSAVRYEDSYFVLRCHLCDRWAVGSHFRYAKERNVMYFEFRQGGF